NTAPETELGIIRHVTRRLRSINARATWLSAMQARSTRIAQVLRMLRGSVIGSSIQRRKTAGAWHLVADGVDVLVVHVRTSGRTLEDLAAPLCLEVCAPDRTNLDRLRDLVSHGLVVLQEDP